jgi:hypothetical protein
MKPSETDLRQAHKILINWKKQKPRSLAHGKVSWKTWLLASEKVPEPFYIPEKNSGTDQYTNLVAMKCVDLLFDSNIGLDELFTEVAGGSDVKLAIRHNEKVWKLTGSLPSPLTMAQIEFIGVYPSYVNMQKHGAHEALASSLD